MRETTTLPEMRLLLKHAKLGIVLFMFGIALIFIIIGIRTLTINRVSDLWISSLLSILVTLMCMGIFSVAYEYYMRTTFAKYMRSTYSAWNTGVTVYPTHRDAPDRSETLSEARKQEEVRFMSTTFSQYFTAVRGLVEQKIIDGVSFRFIIYNPESKAVEEKANEEGVKAEDFKDEIKSVCRRFLGPLVKRHKGKIQVKFCDFNTPFGITIIGDRKMVLSLNIYGLARSKNETPCLVIVNTYDVDSVFKLYERSYDAIWEKLKDTIPESVRPFFEDAKSNT